MIISFSKNTSCKTKITFCAALSAGTKTSLVPRPVPGKEKRPVDVCRRKSVKSPEIYDGRKHFNVMFFMCPPSLIIVTLFLVCSLLFALCPICLLLCYITMHLCRLARGLLHVTIKATLHFMLLDLVVIYCWIEYTSEIKHSAVQLSRFVFPNNLYEARCAENAV